MSHPIYQASDRNSAIRQGEILTGLIQYKPRINQESTSEENQIPFEEFIHPFVIVVTQDCDLDWDYKARQNVNPQNNQSSKLLNSIILCEMDTARVFRDNKDVINNSKEWDRVKSHQHERFYFFEGIPPECDAEQIGLPELTSDFKKVFGIEAEYIYYQVKLGKAKRRVTLISPYLEHFSNCYHNFHRRVALPAPYQSINEG